MEIGGTVSRKTRETARLNCPGSPLITFQVTLTAAQSILSCLGHGRPVKSVTWAVVVVPSNSPAGGFSQASLPSPACVSVTSPAPAAAAPAGSAGSGLLTSTPQVSQHTSRSPSPALRIRQAPTCIQKGGKRESAAPAGKRGAVGEATSTELRSVGSPAADSPPRGGYVY